MADKRNCPLSKRRAGKIFKLNQVEWETAGVETSFEAGTEDRSAISDDCEEIDVTTSSVTMEEISRDEPPNTVSPANSPSSKYSFSFPGRSPRWPHTYHQGVIFSFPAPCFGTAAVSHSERRRSNPPPSVALFSRRWLPSYRLPTVDEKPVGCALPKNDPSAAFGASDSCLNETCAPVQCAPAKPQSPGLPRAWLTASSAVPSVWCDQVGTKSLSQFHGRACGDPESPQQVSGGETDKDLVRDQVDLKCVGCSQVYLVGARQNQVTLYCHCNSSSASQAAAELNLKQSPQIGDSHRCDTDSFCTPPNSENTSAGLEIDVETGNQLGTLSYYSTTAASVYDHDWCVDMDKRSVDWLSSSKNLANKTKLSEIDQSGLGNTKSEIAGPCRHEVTGDNSRRGEILPSTLINGKKEKIGDLKGEALFMSSTAEFPCGKDDDLQTLHRSDLRDRRAFSMERPATGSQLLNTAPRIKPKTSKVEKLRELTERLRPSSLSSSSSSSSGSAASHSQPQSQSQQFSTLPPLPVAPPRTTRSRPERKKSMKNKKDSATSTADLSLNSGNSEVADPVKTVTANSSKEVQSENLEPKQEKLSGPVVSEAERPSLFSLQPGELQRRDSLFSSSRSPARTERNEKESDIFDDSQLTLSKLNPKILVGTYHQRTIPFRSASFSQIDVGADGAYNRRPGTAITLKPVTYSIGRDGTPLLASGPATLPRRKVPNQNEKRKELLALVEDSHETPNNNSSTATPTKDTTDATLNEVSPPTTESISATSEVLEETSEPNVSKESEPPTLKKVSSNESKDENRKSLDSKDEEAIELSSVKTTELDTEENDDEATVLSLEVQDADKLEESVVKVVSDAVDLGNYESTEISVAAEILLNPQSQQCHKETVEDCNENFKTIEESAQLNKPLPVLDLLELNNHLLRLKVTSRQSNIDLDDAEPHGSDFANPMDESISFTKELPDSSSHKLGKEEVVPSSTRSWLAEALRLNPGQRESNSSLSDEGCVPDSDFFSKSDTQVALDVEGTLPSEDPNILEIYSETEEPSSSNEERVRNPEPKRLGLPRPLSASLAESSLGVDSGVCTKSNSSRSLIYALQSKENNNNMIESAKETEANEVTESGSVSRRGLLFSPQTNSESLAQGHLALDSFVSSAAYVDTVEQNVSLDSHGFDTDCSFSEARHFTESTDQNDRCDKAGSGSADTQNEAETKISQVNVVEGMLLKEILIVDPSVAKEDGGEDCPATKAEDGAEADPSKAFDPDAKNPDNSKSRVIVSRSLTLTGANNETSSSNRSPAQTPFRSVSPFSFPSESDAGSDKGAQRSPQTPRRYGLKRRPLRGPYGEMLEAEMNKSEIGKLYTKRSEDLSFLRELCPRNRDAKSSSPRPLSPTSPSALVASSPESVASFLSPSVRQNSLPLPSAHSHSHSLDDSQLKVGYNTTSTGSPNVGPSQSRTLPKRKISANVPFVFSDSALESSTKSSLSSQGASNAERLNSTTICHQRTSSSPSHLMCNEGGFTSEDEPELIELASMNATNKVTKETENDRETADTITTTPTTNISVNRATSFKRHRDTRTHVVRELYDTERSYVESLQILVTKYLQPLKSHEYSGLVEASLVDEMFYQIPDVLAHHEVFLEELRKRLEKWDAKQCVGGVFLQALTKPDVIETYTAFINHWKYAKEAVKTACQAKSAFAKFLGAMAREHKGKLALDSLLIMPVQRIPRYELLIKMLLKHTPRDHPDHPLLMEAQKEVHDLALKINCVEREALGAEQTLATLRELENLVEGLGNLATPERMFIRHDMVSMPSALANRKERAIFLFSDLLLITSVKRRGTAIRKSSALSSSIANTLEANKFKLLMRIPLEDLEICKSKDDSNRRSLRDMEHLEEDLNTLSQLSELASTLHNSHSTLDEVIKELQTSIQRQINEKMASMEPHLATLELAITTSEGTETLSVAFSSSEKRASWEEAFTEAKRKLSVTAPDRRPPPEFLSVLPIRKTRAGLQFTCAAPTSLWNSSSSFRDVWVCNSDGYVGQVCVLTLQPEPNVASCNGVCNARIMCIAAVPPASSRSESSIMEGRALMSESRSGNYSTNTTEDGGSPAGNFELESSESSDNSSDEDDTSAAEDESSPPQPQPQPRRARGDSILAEMSVHSSAEECEVTSQATMWLGTEDGSIHVYHCGENIRLKKNRLRIQQAATVLCIVYVENQVFASLANGDIVIYSRDSSGVWNINDPQIITVGTLLAPVTRMLAVHGKLWCSSQNIVKILNISSFSADEQFAVSSDSQRAVLSMVGAGLGVWVSMQGSAVVRLFHALTHECICDINLAPAVNKMLIGCDDIIRQHKAACLRVTSMLVCRELLWVGTSAGVILTVPIPHLTPTSSRFSSPPPVTGISHGHTGHVRFLTCVEACPEPRSSRSVHRYSVKGKESSSSGSGSSPTSQVLVISGGDGYEDFRNTGFSDSVGREDSTNHLLLWQI